MWHLFANRKKLIVGIIVGVMAIVIFAWRYIAVNKACPPAQVEQYSLGDTVLHNGVEYTLTDYKVLSQDEFCDEYEIDPIHVKASGQESKIIVFTMYAKNVSDHNVNVDFAGQMLLQMGDYLCSYRIFAIEEPLHIKVTWINDSTKKHLTSGRKIMRDSGLSSVRIDNENISNYVKCVLGNI